MSELRECPFCGGDAYFSCGPDDARIACICCGANISVVLDDKPFINEERVRRDMAVLWNQRVLSATDGQQSD